MRVFLDDERSTPEGWTRCYWPAEVISLLQKGLVEEISLDHDLGDKFRAERDGQKEITGMVVLDWIEREVLLNGFKPPVIEIHTANPPMFRKMTGLAYKIQKDYERLQRVE